MSSIVRGTPVALLILLLLAGLLLGAGCAGTKGAGSPVTPAWTTAMPATVPVTAARTLPPAIPPETPVDLSSPPQKATPFPTPSADFITGTWYAPPPDDLTFEFFADGTFTERSPNFRDYHGTWAVSEEGEGNFYDATVLDQWGYEKKVHILITSGTLYIKAMGTLHRIG